MHNSIYTYLKNMFVLAHKFKMKTICLKIKKNFGPQLLVLRAYSWLRALVTALTLASNDSFGLWSLLVVSRGTVCGARDQISVSCKQGKHLNLVLFQQS